MLFVVDFFDLFFKFVVDKIARNRMQIIIISNTKEIFVVCVAKFFGFWNYSAKSWRK